MITPAASLWGEPMVTHPPEMRRKKSMKARDLGRDEVRPYAHSNQKYQGSQHVGITQAGVAGVLPTPRDIASNMASTSDARFDATMWSTLVVGRPELTRRSSAGTGPERAAIRSLSLNGAIALAPVG